MARAVPHANEKAADVGLTLFLQGSTFNYNFLNSFCLIKSALLPKP